MEIHEEIYGRLVESLKKVRSDENLEPIEKAYKLAVEAHEGQFRKSGEPYIIHPIEVAIILSDMEVDIDTIIAGLLHDVIEDTKYTYEEIERMFNKDVAEMVEGVTKLVELQYISKKEEQAENYRKLFLAMSMDARVVLIKIADRLHNMRTLQHMPRHKQIEKSEETLDVYAPLAHRLGISKLRYELEDLAFKYLYEEEYKKITELLNEKETENKDYIEELHNSIKENLKKSNIECMLESRVKHKYSVYKKMINKNKNIEQIYDLRAVRILVNDVGDCYSALGKMHEMYKPLIGRFKDYIAVPKGNMYQSIHNTLLGPGAQPFEMQIRTYKMHKIAENGIAAHWKYKEGKNEKVNGKDLKLAWIDEMLAMQNEVEDNDEYLDTMKVDLDLFNERVYCFTPSGDLKELPRGATPLDFAYYIHTDVGHRAVGAKVDGRIVTFDYTLKNSERVEIITSKTSSPSRDWLKVAKTSNAKSKIKHWFKTSNKEENILHGKALLERESKKKGYKLQDLLSEERIELILKRYDLKDVNSLYSTVGYAGIKEGQIINRLIVECEKRTDSEKEAEMLERLSKPKVEQKDSKGNLLVNIDGLGLTEVNYAKCCNPILGDEIVAYVTIGKGYSLHKKSCKNIITLDEVNKRRLQGAKWADVGSVAQHFNITIQITAFDRHGLLMDITNLLSTEKIKVCGLSTKVIDEKAIIRCEVEVSSSSDAEIIVNKLRSIKDVYEIERVK